MLTFATFQNNHGARPGGQAIRGPRIIINPSDIMSIQEGGRWEIDPNNRNFNIFTTVANMVFISMKGGQTWHVEADFDLLSETLESLNKLKG